MRIEQTEIYFYLCTANLFSHKNQWNSWRSLLSLFNFEWVSVAIARLEKIRKGEKQSFFSFLLKRVVSCRFVSFCATTNLMSPMCAATRIALNYVHIFLMMSSHSHLRMCYVRFLPLIRVVDKQSSEAGRNGTGVWDRAVICVCSGFSLFPFSVSAHE